MVHCTRHRHCPIQSSFDVHVIGCWRWTILLHRIWQVIVSSNLEESVYLSLSVCQINTLANRIQSQGLRQVYKTVKSIRHRQNKFSHVPVDARCLSGLSFTFIALSNQIEDESLLQIPGRSFAESRGFIFLRCSCLQDYTQGHHDCKDSITTPCWTSDQY